SLELDPPGDLLVSVLENAEVGLAVVDPSNQAVYMNASARAVLESPLGEIPEWLVPDLAATRGHLDRAQQLVERVVHGDVTLRVHLRELAQAGHVLVELQVTQVGGGSLEEQLTRSIGLSAGEAKLLSLLWRGLSNEEIAQLLSVRTGTVKSRLFRLYQKLGVKKRPAAVLRAAEVLGAHAPPHLSD